MGNVKCMAITLAAVTAACSSEPSRPYAGGSLFLMNQTHGVVELALYRAAELDCVAVARDPRDGLARTSFHFERCLGLMPAELVALDRYASTEQAPPCEAVALSGAGFGPRALFWTDTAERDAPASVDATLELVTVNGELVLDPAANAALVTLPSLPDHPCDWAR